MNCAALIKAQPQADNTSFVDSVNYYKNKVKNAATSDENYQVVLKAVQGLDQINFVNQQKALMFHEMVISPLGNLTNEFTPSGSWSADNPLPGELGSS